MPDDLQNAVVAAENRSFWSDNGIDPRGIVRAAFSNATGNSTQGASTITQQYVKILYLTQERSYERKVKEAVLSLKLQRTKSKSEILEGYLNTIYFGRGAYGVQAAAEAYFNTRRQGPQPAPGGRARERAQQPDVLRPRQRRGLPARAQGALRLRARRDGDGRQHHRRAEAEQAKQRLPKFPKIKAESKYGGQKGHMLTMVRDELQRARLHGRARSTAAGLRVTTTFTKKAMAAAEEGVEEQRPEGKEFSDKHLHIAVGHRRARHRRGPRASTAARTTCSPRSTGRSPAARSARRSSRSPWPPRSRTASPSRTPSTATRRSTTARTAPARRCATRAPATATTTATSVSLLHGLEESINTVFADLTVSMPDGPDKILETAEDLGIPDWDKNQSGYNNLDNSPGLEPVTGIALGSATIAPVNMANAYATIANGGRAAAGPRRHQGREQGRRGRSTSFKQQHQAGRLRGRRRRHVVRHAAGREDRHRARPRSPSAGPAAGKTGTATASSPNPAIDDYVSSAWFVGYTPQLSTAVMYVRGKGQGQLDGWLPEYFGGSYPARTWTDVMGRVPRRHRGRGLPAAGQPRRRRPGRRPRAVHAEAQAVEEAEAVEDPDADAQPPDAAGRPRTPRCPSRPRRPTTDPACGLPGCPTPPTDPRPRRRPTPPPPRRAGRRLATAASGRRRVRRG